MPLDVNLDGRRLYMLKSQDYHFMVSRRTTTTPMTTRDSQVVHFDSNLLYISKIAKCHCKLKCECCGGEMTAEQELEKTIIYKCTECGLSNSVLKNNLDTAKRAS
jgi:hypothetical protein